MKFGSPPIVIPDATPCWFGARAIHEATGRGFTLLGDRMQWTPALDKEFACWIDAFALPKARAWAKSVTGASSLKFTLASPDGLYTYEATPNASHGYIYMAAWKTPPAESQAAAPGMNSFKFHGRHYTLPSKDDIQNLKPGDIAPCSLGSGPVIEITGRGINVFGRAYVCYYVNYRHPENSACSASLVEGEIFWPLDTPFSYEARCAIRHAYEPKPILDHYGYPIDSDGRRTGPRKETHP